MGSFAGPVVMAATIVMGKSLMMPVVMEKAAATALVMALEQVMPRLAGLSRFTPSVAGLSGPQGQRKCQNRGHDCEG